MNLVTHRPAPRPRRIADATARAGRARHRARRRPRRRDAPTPVAPHDARSRTRTRTSVARGKYLVTVAGLQRLPHAVEDGPDGPEPDMSRMLSGHPERSMMPPAPQAPDRSVARDVGGDEHRVGGSVGRELHREPDAGPGDRARQVDGARTSSRRSAPAVTWGRGRPILPPMPIPMYRNFTDERPGGDLRVPAVRSRRSEPGAGAAAAGGAGRVETASASARRGPGRCRSACPDAAGQRAWWPGVVLRKICITSRRTRPRVKRRAAGAAPVSTRSPVGTRHAGHWLRCPPWPCGPPRPAAGASPSSPTDASRQRLPVAFDGRLDARPWHKHRMGIGWSREATDACVSSSAPPATAPVGIRQNGRSISSSGRPGSLGFSPYRISAMRSALTRGFET